MNLYIGINVLVYGKCLMVNVWSMTKKSFCFKNTFFAKHAIFSKIMLIQAPYIPSTHLEMEELQLRLLEKQLPTKFF